MARGSLSRYFTRTVMNRKQVFFLAISPNGSQRLSGRMLKSMPSLDRSEIALQLTVELPSRIAAGTSGEQNAK
jgi:hypothetical protein